MRACVAQVFQLEMSTSANAQIDQRVMNAALQSGETIEGLAVRLACAVTLAPGQPVSSASVHDKFHVITMVNHVYLSIAPPNSYSALSLDRIAIIDGEYGSRMEQVRAVAMLAMFGVQLDVSRMHASVPSALLTFGTSTEACILEQQNPARSEALRLGCAANLALLKGGWRSHFERLSVVWANLFLSELGSTSPTWKPLCIKDVRSEAETASNRLPGHFPGHVELVARCAALGLDEPPLQLAPLGVRPDRQCSVCEQRGLSWKPGDTTLHEKPSGCALLTMDHYFSIVGEPRPKAKCETFTAYCRRCSTGFHYSYRVERDKSEGAADGDGAIVFDACAREREYLQISDTCVVETKYLSKAELALYHQHASMQGLAYVMAAGHEDVALRKSVLPDAVRVWGLLKIFKLLAWDLRFTFSKRERNRWIYNAMSRAVQHCVVRGVPIDETQHAEICRAPFRILLLDAIEKLSVKCCNYMGCLNRPRDLFVTCAVHKDHEPAYNELRAIAYKHGQHAVGEALEDQGVSDPHTGARSTRQLQALTERQNRVRKEAADQLLSDMQRSDGKAVTEQQRVALQAAKTTHSIFVGSCECKTVKFFNMMRDSEAISTVVSIIEAHYGKDAIDLPAMIVYDRADALLAAFLRKYGLEWNNTKFLRDIVWAYVQQRTISRAGGSRALARAPRSRSLRAAESLVFCLPLSPSPSTLPFMHNYCCSGWTSSTVRTSTYSRAPLLMRGLQCSPSATSQSRAQSRRRSTRSSLGRSSTSARWAWTRRSSTSSCGSSRTTNLYTSTSSTSARWLSALCKCASAPSSPRRWHQRRLLPAPAIFWTRAPRPACSHVRRGTVGARLPLESALLQCRKLPRCRASAREWCPALPPRRAVCAASAGRQTSTRANVRS